MNSEIPRWPSRVTREQSRQAKEREKLFQASLKAASKASGWRYANCGIFRQQGDWFASVLPRLLWERGVTLMLMVKPTAVDPIFWSIVGLEENNRLPLSFRANGAWVLRSPYVDAQLALGEIDPEKLANEVLRWSSNQLINLNSLSVEQMLLNVEGMGALRRHHVALEVCLRLLLDDLNGALDICQGVPADYGGGFGIHHPDGSYSTFIDQAREWIAIRRGLETQHA